MPNAMCNVTLRAGFSVNAWSTLSKKLNLVLSSGSLSCSRLRQCFNPSGQMSFSVYNSEITLYCGGVIVTHNIDNDTVDKLSLPEMHSSKKDTLHNRMDVDFYHAITNVSYSRDGEYFLVCTNRKQLCLYRRKNRTLVSNRTLVRAASRVKFTADNDIVVADKSGDAYVYSTSKPEEAGTSLLGHLSMLLDVMVTEDLKYIITTDRDEKIRVSMYPNCYNILSYCLGHEKFVTNVKELPHDKSILVSSSGDGCLKFWDFQNGKELLSVDVNEYVREEDVKEFNKSLKDCDLDEDVNILPLRHLMVSKINDSTSIVMATLFSCKRLFLYTLSGEKSNKLAVNRRQIVEFEDEPLKCVVQNDNMLWVLFEQGLRVYMFNETFFRENKDIGGLEKINKSWIDIRNEMNTQTLFPILYKRKFDNVQDYQERKRSRLLAKVSE
ncbi:tRNA (guanine-N(7)-)-methyltransferase non-catalytic subunit wdr4 [Athalia rosae]|uniref:tRNA (guanine-N(7)-)-methyltransferase non-catalytic subunit wdr4 n=1 Tax=Athalia rosae TaxID=37344 RepID=UPI0020347981|nr:tRNA (guanine-N(7)-)-methyltransferase non-catalytic subunit wdr4 [Athalia rosae]